MTDLIHRVFEDIKGKKQLSDFHAAKRMKRGVAGALVDAVIIATQVRRARVRFEEVFH